VACRPDGVKWTAPNDAEGIAATVARLRTMVPSLIVAEATGGYERALVATRRNLVIRAFYRRLLAAGKPTEARAHRVHAQAC